MPTAPPVLPPRDERDELRQSWLQRQRADAGNVLRLGGYLVLIFAGMLLVGFALARLRGIDGVLGITFAWTFASVLTAAAGIFILKATGAAGATARAITFPTGASVPYEEQFSYQDSLVARGDVEGALASYEAIITERPDLPLPRLRAAELHARAGHSPERAAVLFRSVRDMPAATPHDSLYASNRLIDLYEGPLNDPGRTLVELRRIIERYPGTQAAGAARAALARLKPRMAAEDGVA
jgi:hypothetical protein